MICDVVEMNHYRKTVSVMILWRSIELSGFDLLRWFIRNELCGVLSGWKDQDAFVSVILWRILGASFLPLLCQTLPGSTPPPPHVCHGDHEELPPSSSCLQLPPLSEHAFPEGRLLFIPSGGLTVNLLHWGKFLGTGPISVGYFESGPHSGSRSVHLCVFALI